MKGVGLNSAHRCVTAPIFADSRNNLTAAIAAGTA
jgi:hypothetical protein